MRELKTENPFPAVPALASDPDLKKSRPARSAKEVAQPEGKTTKTNPQTPIEIGDGPSALESMRVLDLSADATTETPKRRQRQAAQNSKPATSKAKKKTITEAALTEPKWDLSKQLILDRFRQLEQDCTQIKTQAEELNQQSTAIQAEIEHLRTIARQVTSVISPPPLSPNTYRAKPTGGRDSVDGKTARTAAAISAPPHSTGTPITSPVQPARAPSVSPVSSQRSRPVPPISDKLLAIAHAAYHAASPQPPTAPASRAYSRREPGQMRTSAPMQMIRQWLERWWQTMPEARGVIAIDALALVFGAVALRLGLQVIVNTLPALTGLLSSLIVLPILLALYLALFKPKAKAVVIYRLLLISLGLVLGGKL